MQQKIEISIVFSFALNSSMLIELPRSLC